MIKTERLNIQKLKAEDWKCLKDIAIDFRRSEYALYDMPLPIEDEEIQSLCERFSASECWFSAWLGDNMIGYICWHQNEIGYDLGFCFLSEYHGKGLAFEACSALIRYMANEHNVQVFTAGTALKNTPSCKLLEKLGFVRVGTETLSFHRDENGDPIVFEGGQYRLNMCTVVV